MVLEDFDQRKGETEKKHDRTQQILFGGVVGIGVITFFFGFFYIRNNIQGPFRLQTTNKDTLALGTTSQLITTLQSRDTDHDTLNDYDELYVYGTSPYLSDSDSDGVADNVEVQKGTDPNCAGTETCSPIAVAQPPTDTTNGNSNDGTGLSANTDLGALFNTAAANTNGSLSVADLRTALRNAGAPAATLESIDDQTLLTLYQQVTTTGSDTNVNGVFTNSNAVSVTNGNAAVITNSIPANTNSTTIDPTTLQNLSSDQIRTFLIQGGADATTLQGVDDATLRSIFQEALQNVPAS